MHDLDNFFHGVSGDFFNNGMQFIDFPPEDLEPRCDFGEASCDAGFERPESPAAAVPPSLSSALHYDTPEQKPTIHRPDDHHVSTTKSFHFLKIISEDSIQDGKLEIPAHFLDKYFSHVNEISCPIVLELPSSEKWEVELLKSDGEMWLQKGWKEFAEHYSLKSGYAVVFRYEGDCKFHVIVFDMTYIEIDYLRPSTGDDYLSVDILSEPSSCCKRQERSSTPCTRPSKIRKIDSTKRTPMNSIRKIDSTKTTPMNSNSEIKRSKGIAGMKRRQATVEKKHTLSRKEKAEALKIAASFKSKNPYFLAVMQPSFLSPTYRVTIPAYFSNDFLKTEHGKVNLYLNGKSWSAKWYCAKGYTDLRSGWRSFANDNNLEVGDVCAFEMIDDLNMSWKVVIHRRAKEATPSSSLDTNGPLASIDDFCSNPEARKESLTYKERARALERTKSFKSDKPFFVVVMQPGYITNALFIPLAFTKKHFRANGYVSLRIPDGRTWRVPYKKRSATLGGSWKAFVRDNNIQVGDACVFELIEGKRMVLNVVIFPTSDADRSSSTSDSRAEVC